MKNFKLCIYYFTAIVLAMLCVTSVQSASTVVMDFTRSNLGGGTGIVTDKPTITCDRNSLWTCMFTATEALSYRYVNDVALAHINADGSIYLQEIDTTTEDLSDNWSVTLPGWYVSNGLTNYSLVGTDCTFTIKPVISGGNVTDWTMSVKGKGRDKTATCGGDTDHAGGKGKSGKEKKHASGKGPGPK